jgi:hypothetical protein
VTLQLTYATKTPMRFKIIALDLDGTALDSREAIRPRMSTPEQKCIG